MPHRDLECLRVGVMVTTYKRPGSLLRTLESLATQEKAGAEMDVHVIDNACDPDVERLVQGIARRTGLAARYHAEPQRGVASARNRALSLLAPEMDYLAFIDDDEIASPLWLASLLRTAHVFQAEIVQGPVEPAYETEAPGWFRKGRFTALGPFRDGGELRFGFSGNVLLSVRMLRETGIRFDPRFDRSGGEDQHFFMALMASGYRILTSRDAIVFETIPASRISLADFIRRRFRIGATLTVAWRMLSADRTLLPKRIAVGLGHTALGIAGCCPPWRWSGDTLAFNLGRVAYGLGQIVGAAGVIGASYDSVHIADGDRREGEKSHGL